MVRYCTYFTCCLSEPSCLQSLGCHQPGVRRRSRRSPRRSKGVHGIATAAKIWGLSTDEYLQKADPWPLNLNGELMLGVKIEDRCAFANREETLKVPGLSFGESGPSDMALSLGIKTSDPRMRVDKSKDTPRNSLRVPFRVRLPTMHLSFLIARRDREPRGHAGAVKCRAMPPFVRRLNHVAHCAGYESFSFD